MAPYVQNPSLARQLAPYALIVLLGAIPALALMGTLVFLVLLVRSWLG